jgi:hypothetical protein
MFFVKVAIKMEKKDAFSISVSEKGTGCAFPSCVIRLVSTAGGS